MGTIQKARSRRKKSPFKPMSKKFVLLLFVFGVLEGLFSQQLKAQDVAKQGTAKKDAQAAKDAQAKDASPNKGAADSGTDKPEPHEFLIANFHTESGVTLPQARVVYATYGHLNAARDNAVLLPSHYMATFHGYEWLIGPDRALDTSKLFLVATELFGNGHSSSPSNTPEPYHGPRFPVTTIRDNVPAVHRLRTD